MGDVEGTATYAGPASGFYMKKTFAPDGTPTPVGSGQFTAEAVLNASFGGDDVAVNNQFRIGGDVSSFRNSDVGNFTAGTTTGNGSWQGRFHGADDPDTADVREQPSSASGTFTGHFLNGHVAGAFGATIQE